MPHKARKTGDVILDLKSLHKSRIRDLGYKYSTKKIAGTNYSRITLASCNNDKKKMNELSNPYSCRFSM